MCYPGMITCQYVESRAGAELVHCAPTADQAAILVCSRCAPLLGLGTHQVPPFRILAQLPCNFVPQRSHEGQAGGDGRRGLP